MNKLRICFLIPDFAIGGAQRQLIFLINELKKDINIEVHLVYFREGVNFWLLEKDGIQLHKIESKSLFNPLNILKIFKVLKIVKPQIMFSWLQATDFYCFIIKFIFPKIVWIMAERDSKYPSNFIFGLRNFGGRFADAIIANSDAGKEYWLKKNVNPDILYVISNILIVKRKVKNVSLNINEKINIVYAGRLETQKNILLLTEAFCDLSKAYPNFYFKIIGEGSLKNNIQNIIEDSGCIKNVQIFPFQKDIVNIFSQADIFINVSLHEGLPNTVIENLALGNPLVLSYIDEHVKLLGENYPYYVKDYTKKENIIKSILNIFEQPFESDLLVFGNQRLNEMSPEVVALKYLNTFQSYLK